MNNKKKQIVLVGSGGFSSELIQYLKDIIKIDNSLEIYGIVDNYLDHQNVKQIDGVNFLGKEEDLIDYDEKFFLIANGNNNFRKSAYIRLKNQNRKIYTLIHPSAYISPNCKIGEGSIICPNSIINSNTEIGKAALINVFSSIGHHSRIGDYCVLSPFSSVSGYASIGEGTFLGTRATIFPKVNLGKYCTVDSHTYVKSNVENCSIVSLRCEYLIIKDRLRNKTDDKQ